MGYVGYSELNNFQIVPKHLNTDLLPDSPSECKSLKGHVSKLNLFIIMNLYWVRYNSSSIKKYLN